MRFKSLRICSLSQRLPQNTFAWRTVDAARQLQRMADRDELARDYCQLICGSVRAKALDPLKKQPVYFGFWSLVVLLG